MEPGAFAVTSDEIAPGAIMLDSARAQTVNEMPAVVRRVSARALPASA